MVGGHCPCGFVRGDYDTLSDKGRYAATPSSISLMNIQLNEKKAILILIERTLTLVRQHYQPTTNCVRQLNIYFISRNISLSKRRRVAILCYTVGYIYASYSLLYSNCKSSNC